MAAQALIFDLDGTLWDSYPWYASMITSGDGAQEAHILRELRDGGSVITIAGRAGLSKAGLIRRIPQCLAGLALYPDVRDTLACLRLRSIPLGVVTSLSGDLALAMLEGLGLRETFGTIVHPGNCRSRKLTGVPLLQAVGQLGITEGAVYIGDKLDDAQCAKAAGIPFAWASYGYGKKPEGGLTVLDRFREVLAL